MSYDAHSSFLDLSIGPVNLALRTACVVTVLQDIVAAPTLQFRSRVLPMAALSDVLALSSAPASGTLPFVLVIEHRDEGAAVAVGAVRHLQYRDAPSLLRLPTFALRDPTIFAGALRFSDRLMLVLAPAGLVRCVRSFCTS